MSEFVNTRDVIGDQATVDGLVDHSLTELKDDSVYIVERYAIKSNGALRTIEFPNATLIQQDSFNGCNNLETIKFGGYGSTAQLSIKAGAFSNSYNIKHVVFDLPQIVDGDSITSNAVGATKVGLGEGAIYVPSNMVNSYKNSSMWKFYYIEDISNYPLTNFDTIKDSWSTILSNASYSTDYNIRDTKTLELSDGTKIKMDIAAFDTDDKSDDSGKAKITWICHAIPYNNNIYKSPYNSGGWGGSHLRNWLTTDILPKIPSEIRSHIVSVKKTYRVKSSSNETLTSDDEIWIPSFKEVGFTNASYIESDGVRYDTYFPSGTTNAINRHRQKYVAYQSAIQGGYWWLRSEYDGSNFSAMSTFGSDTKVGTNITSWSGSAGVVFGFCTD